MKKLNAVKKFGAKVANKYNAVGLALAVPVLAHAEDAGYAAYGTTITTEMGSMKPVLYTIGGAVIGLALGTILLPIALRMLRKA